MNTPGVGAGQNSLSEGNYLWPDIILSLTFIVLLLNVFNLNLIIKKRIRGKLNCKILKQLMCLSKISVHRR